MLPLIPRDLPPLSLMLDDIGRPPAKQLAKALGVSVSTVKRWEEKGDAPRAVLLALFWITRWGRGAVYAEAHNQSVMFYGLANAYRSERDQAQTDLAHVLALRDTGAANLPIWKTLPMASVTPLPPAPAAKEEA